VDGVQFRQQYLAQGSSATSRLKRYFRRQPDKTGKNSVTFCKVIANTHPERAKLFFGHAGESWQQALERFDKFSTAVVDEWHDDDSDSTHSTRLSDTFVPEDLLLRHEPLSVTAVRDLERMHGTQLPRELVDLLTKHGGFTIWPTNSIPCFEFLNSTDPAYPPIRNMRRAMEYQGLFSFLQANISAESLAKIEHNYFCFAIAHFADADMAFLLFDREGHFAIYDFVDEDVDYSIRGIQSLLQPSASNHGLDDLLRCCVNWSIYSLLNAAEVPVDEYSDWRNNWRNVFPAGDCDGTDRVWKMRTPTID
jgi:hypothetical protein